MFRFTTVLKVLVAGLTATQTMLAGAQNSQPAYPSKPIKVLVGVPPGGSTDVIARLFADWLQGSMGQPGVVENRPGANTAMAADAVSRSAPDGYSLLVATEALLTMPLLAKQSFDPVKSFVPIGAVGLTHFVLAVHPTLPVNSVRELINYARAHPGRISYGSSGNAGTSHLGLEKFKLLTGTQMVHIPYRGAGPALTDAVSGQYQVSLWTPLAIAQQVKTGKLKALAVTGSRRIPMLKQVPTFAEVGLPAYDHKSWYAVFAPAGTPKPIVERLNAEISKMLASPKIRQKFDDAGVEPLVSTPEQLTSMMRSDTNEVGRLIKGANIKID
ncbi:Bug family tripartite tricarboxylate transporter substrate binding protein [Cupriavidus alkaliphilus]|uniref:Bug family tripartite tricarboxylate transporter substrate binding protein n=1 Tax=Cupriavidus alkaliphilus TaxID=942866 RepID=UPI0016132F70|nr:tripartite tricarboxylate transporter substrate binding protein [Cupriavidus alkaliphilus]MBB3014136.1 tripartite-type tricarboxylate transporter receptor subunit TctC [Cupriavidus alkaliphilus]